jgi:polyferredoxin
MSPYLSMRAAFEGFVSGSLALFAVLFLSSLVLGRAFCGWVCPGGYLQDLGRAVNDKRRPRKHGIKFIIWTPWFSAIVFGLVKAGGPKKVLPLYMTESGVSVSEPLQYITYYLVLALILGLALATGRRGFCHYGCWMAPFMLVGRKARNIANWAALQLKSRPDKCTSCATCVEVCPMSINVTNRVRAGRMEDKDCILCGRCVDNCPSRAIRYSFGRKG